MIEGKEIFGCFVSGPSVRFEDSEESKIIARKKGQEFRTYVWGEIGIDHILKKLNNEDYGEDLKLALFQFYLIPLPFELQGIRDIEEYRKGEKSIGMSIIITDENFFSKSEEGRYNFLKQSILQKLDLLSDTVKKKKLDTRVDLLKADLKKLL